MDLSPDGPRAIRIQLLGPVRAWWGDQEIDLGSARRRAVFAMLALRPDVAVSNAELVDGLWGEQPSSNAVGTLHTYVYDLRRALKKVAQSSDAASVLETVGSSYALRLPAEQVDEHRFRQLDRSAQEHWERGDLSTAADEMDTALALWQGVALDGMPGPFAELHSARLSEQLVVARERRAALRLASCDHATAVTELTELIVDNPLRESLRGLLMVALHQTGQDQAALDLFAETERVLVAEQGIEPGPALQRIHGRLTAGQPVSAEDLDGGMWPAAAAGSDNVLPDNGRPAVPDLFEGRERELGWFRFVMRDLADGGGSCLWVEGEQGIGKTALLAAVVADLPADTRVVWSTGDEHQKEPERVIAAVQDACAIGPVVFVIDDVHRLDSAGLRLWHQLSRLIQQLPLVLIGASRPVTAGSELKQVRNAVTAVGGRVLYLGSLVPEAIATIARRRLGAQCGPNLAELLGCAAGNPSYVAELLDVVVESGALRIDAGTADIDASMGPQLRAAVTTVVLRRLDFLAPHTWTVLRWAALLGTEFEVADLAAIMGVSALSLGGVIGETTAAGVIEERGRALAFRDPAIQRLLYEEWPEEARKAQHNEAARALDEAGAPIERVGAQVLAASPELDGWGIGWLRGHIRAIAVQNPTLAADLMYFGVVCSTATGAELEDLKMRRIRLLFQIGRDSGGEAGALLEVAEGPENLAELRWMLAQLCFFRGEVDLAFTHLAEVERAPDAPEVWKVRCHTLKVNFEHASQSVLDVEHPMDVALDRAAQSADPAAITDVLQELWYVETVDRDHLMALNHIDRALAAVVGNPELVVRQFDLLDKRAFTLQNLNRLSAATTTLEQMSIFAERYGVSTGVHHVSTAVHYYWLGRWDDALAELEQISESGPGADLLDRRRTPLLKYGVRALIAAHRGELDVVREQLARADLEHPVVNTIDQDNSDFLVAARAMYAGLSDGPEAELQAMDPLLDTDYGRTMLRHQWLPRVVRLAASVGDDERMARALRLCAAEATAEVAPLRAHAALRWCEGLANGDLSSLLVTARHFGDVGRTVEMAQALVDAAELIARRGERERARRTFEDARTIYAELGAASDVREAEARMLRHGVDLTGATTTRAMVGWHTLSEIERRVAKLVAEYKSNAEIAAELLLSRRDVHEHLSRVMQKLRVGSRSELVNRLERSSGSSASGGVVKEA